MGQRRKVSVVSSAGDESGRDPPKKPRKPNFTEDDIRLLLNRYLDKNDIFQSITNSAIIIRSQKKEWELIAKALNTQSPLLNRTWTEVRKKYYDFVSEAKKLYAKQKLSLSQTGGGTVDPDVGFYADMPFYARFILEHILPGVIVDGLPHGFESATVTMGKNDVKEDVGVTAQILLEGEGKMQGDGEDDHIGGDLSAPLKSAIDLAPPSSSPPTTSSKELKKPLKMIDKHQMDKAVYDATLAERRKFDAQADFLIIKTECERVKHQLLHMKLEEKEQKKRLEKGGDLRLL